MDDIFFESKEQSFQAWIPSQDELKSDPLDQYLDRKFLVGYPKEDKSPEQTVNHKHQHAQSQEGLSQISEFRSSPKSKSPFHNFQKHLITIIRRTTKLESCQSFKQESLVAIKLWSAFLKTRSFKKKVLHMVFGLAEDDLEIEKMVKMSMEFQEFRPLFMHYSPSQILSGQQTLRQIVADKGSDLTRQDLKKVCHVNRFDQIYEYFISFMGELRNGPLNMRMTKQSKQKVMEKVKQTRVIFQ